LIEKSTPLTKRDVLERTYSTGIPRGIPAVEWYFRAENL